MDQNAYIGADAPQLYTKIVHCLTNYAQTLPDLIIRIANENIPDTNEKTYTLSYIKDVLGTTMPEIQIQVILTQQSVAVRYFETTTTKTIYLDLKQDIIRNHFPEYLSVWLEALDYSTSRHDFETFQQFMQWYYKQTFRNRETRCRNAVDSLTREIRRTQRATALAMSQHKALNQDTGHLKFIPSEILRLINSYAQQ